MAKFRFEKIVRDKVPQILSDQDIIFVRKNLSHDQTLSALKEKLMEEAQEVNEAHSHENLRDEIADTMEVIESLLQHSGLTWDEITQARKLKNDKRGAFKDAVYISTVESYDGHTLEKYHYEDPLKYPHLYSFQKGDAEITLHEHSYAPVDTEILKRLREFNSPYFGSKPAQHFTLETRKSDQLVGGGTGFIKQDVCFINVLYLDDDQRKTGLGSELLKIIKDFAVTKHCTKLDLETFEFQAREFYEKHGFKVLQKIENWLGGQTMYFMRKTLEKS